MTSPVFSVTSRLLELSLSVSEQMGRLSGLSAAPPSPKLRKDNRVRTVQATVAIEGNSLTLDQVTTLLDGKRVVGPYQEVLEVQNANAAYEHAPKWRPWSQKDLLDAHGVLMKGLAPDAGQWRTGGVGVFRGSRVAHVAPPPRQVPRLMASLLEWGSESDTPMLIKSAVVHYELQFIHPFSDGNGRLGRLWQQVVLLRVNPLFAVVPVESSIKDRQAEYYDVLGKSDRAGDCTPFLEFSLTGISDALKELTASFRPEPETAASRLDAAEQAFGRQKFSRIDYLRLHKRLSTASASRDLREGVDNGRLQREGDRRTARYSFRSAPRS